MPEMTRRTPGELWVSPIFWTRWGSLSLWEPWPLLREIARAGDAVSTCVVGNMIRVNGGRWGVIIQAPGQSPEPHLLVELQGWLLGSTKGATWGPGPPGRVPPGG